MVSYASKLEQYTAQTDAAGTFKQRYDMGQSQRAVDYQIIPRIVRSSGYDVSGGATFKTTVYVEAELPKGLTYIPNSSYWGGTYTQDGEWKEPGAVEGGILLNPHIDVKNDGTTVLRWELKDVEFDANATTQLDTIYYSCDIGRPGDTVNDVADGQELVAKAKIWTLEGNTREFNAVNENVTQCSIQIVKERSLSISKTADHLVGDVKAPIGFSMNIGNNSGSSIEKTVIVEALPFNGLNGSRFSGPLVVTELSAGTSNADTNGAMLSGFTFYYTTDKQYAGQTGETIKNIDFAADDSGWIELSVDSQQNSESSGLPLGRIILPVEAAQGGELYPGESAGDEDANYEQIVAIAAVGTLPENETMKLHVTVMLPQGKSGDLLVNYLYQDDVVTNSRNQTAKRSLGGLTWLDADGDGIRDKSEALLDGVEVTLLKLRDGGSALEEEDYEEVCYADSTDDSKKVITIHTGEMVSVQAHSADGPEAYEAGRYQFTDLPAGTYAVRFTSSEGTPIEQYIASPANKGSDEEEDSDGLAVYSDNHAKLLRTVIKGIELPDAGEMIYASHDSRYHDSGFYEKGVKLPDTGGMGTRAYTLAGFVICVTAEAVWICQRRRRRYTE